MSTPATDVVVTGLGATTPLGADVATTWDALLAGRSGVSRITDDWIKEFPAQLVARLAAEPTELIDRVRARRLDRRQPVAGIAAAAAPPPARGARAPRRGPRAPPPPPPTPVSPPNGSPSCSAPASAER